MKIPLYILVEINSPNDLPTVEAEYIVMSYGGDILTDKWRESYLRKICSERWLRDYKAYLIYAEPDLPRNIVTKLRQIGRNDSISDNDV